LRTAKAARRITLCLVMQEGKWVEPAAMRLRPHSSRLGLLVATRAG